MAERTTSLQRSRGIIEADSQQKSLLRNGRAGGFFATGRGKPSELISQSYLDYPRGIQDAMTAPAWNSKRRASDIAIYMAKRVAVERVRNIQLERCAKEVEFGSFGSRKAAQLKKLFVVLAV